MAASFRRVPQHRAALREALGSRELLVVGLCAAWCNTCGEFFEVFEGVARATPKATFVWLDVEDDAEMVGDLDIENFPTLAIFDRSRAVHFGVSLPQAGNLKLIVRSLGRQTGTVAVDDAVANLAVAIGSWSAQ